MPSFTKRLIVASLFSVLFASMPVTDAGAERKNASAATQIVARVNGVDITKERLDVAINDIMPQVAFHSSVSEKRLKKIADDSLDGIIKQELIYKYAKENKLDNVSEKELNEEVANLKKKLPRGETLENVLKRSNMTMANLKEDFKKTTVVARVSSKKTEEFSEKAKSSVNEAFMKNYYQKNLNKFKEPEQIHLRSILIKADPSGGQRVWNESLKKANEVAKQARSGEDFAKLAEKYSEDPNAKNGGDMGWAHAGSLFPEIDEAASTMEAGQVSDPVATIYGYHILKLEGRKPSVQKKFEDLNIQNLEEELEAKEKKMLWQNWIKDLKKNAKIEYFRK